MYRRGAKSIRIARSPFQPFAVNDASRPDRNHKHSMLSRGYAVDDTVISLDSHSVVVLRPSKRHRIRRSGIFVEIGDRLQYPAENALAYLNFQKAEFAPCAGQEGNRPICSQILPRPVRTVSRYPLPSVRVASLIEGPIHLHRSNPDRGGAAVPRVSDPPGSTAADACRSVRSFWRYSLAIHSISSSASWWSRFHCRSLRVVELCQQGACAVLRMMRRGFDGADQHRA